VQARADAPGCSAANDEGVGQTTFPVKSRTERYLSADAAPFTGQHPGC
jgi:hypothetical protein